MSTPQPGPAPLGRPAAADPAAMPSRADATELRIALVCYGGVSLAIYMHGITKELQALLRASRAFDEGRRPEGGTEQAYYDQLVQLKEAGVGLSVTIDLIAGSSAGGINGVCLAKAVVSGSDQQELTNLWMTKGDIRKLMRYGRLGTRMGGALTALAIPLRARHTWSPLRGDEMCVWLSNALAGMSGDGSRTTLLPDEGTLDLYVTATDLRGTDQIIPLETGGGLHDRTYSRVFAFHSDPTTAARVAGRLAAQAAQLTIDADRGAMAFAARATSSFPGAFPPISLTDFASALQAAKPPASFDAKGLAPLLMPEYRMLRGQDPTSVYLMDGGVLNNAPFDHVVEAIARQPASRQVARHLIYIEPDPGGDSPGAWLPEASGKTPGAPSWFAGVWAAMSTIPHHQPLLGVIRQLAAMNQDVLTIGQLTATLQDEVNAHLRGIAIDPAHAQTLGFADLSGHAKAIYDAVPVVVGQLNYRTYCRLKMQSIARRLARDLSDHLDFPAGSPQASFLRAALAGWLVNRPQWLGDDDSRTRWLGPLDVPYRERRLEFIIAGINQLFAAATATQIGTRDIAAPSRPSRDELSRVKEMTWDLLVKERGKPAIAIEAIAARIEFVTGSALGDTVLTMDPQRWARDHASELDELVAAYAEQMAILTKDSAAELWNSFQEATTGWDENVRTGLAARYVGFPLWDALLFPVQSLSRLPLLNPIHTTRFSPRDAKALEPLPGMKEKLEGVSTFHFGAFFDLTRRQNDYLWGRLDGAELILGLLRDEHARHRQADAPPLPTGEEFLTRALTAVLDSEESALDKVRDRIAALRNQL